VAAAALVAALALVATAWGHAHPDTTTPAKGEVVQTSPSSVVITFVEEIQKTAGTYGLTVETDGGTSVTSGAPTIDPANAAKLSVALKPDLAAGRYVVNWHNVSSEDGDPAEGAFSFYVKTQPTADDLAKDAELELVGQEEEEMTPEATMAPEATPTSQSVIAPAPATPAGAQSPSATLPRTGDGSSGSGANRWALPMLASAAAAALVLAAAAGISMRRGR
jgi:methionine-rich copper-binding protein CopC